MTGRVAGLRNPAKGNGVVARIHSVDCRLSRWRRRNNLDRPLMLSTRGTRKIAPATVLEERENISRRAGRPPYALGRI